MNENGSGGGVAVSIIKKDDVVTCNAWPPLSFIILQLATSNTY